MPELTQNKSDRKRWSKEKLASYLTKNGFTLRTGSDDPNDLDIYYNQAKMGFMEEAGYNDWEIISENPTGFKILDQILENITLWAWYGDAQEIAEAAITTYQA